jgi:hypothetical protein
MKREKIKGKRQNEKDISTKQDQARQDPRIQKTDGNQSRQTDY